MYQLIGHAIVSADDCIADAQGFLPQALHNERDWEIFQAALDRSSLVLLGRTSHDASPNPRKRKRLVASRTANQLEERDDGYWFNPSLISLEASLSRLLPAGGTVAVVGGQGVFDLVGAHRFDEFHLVRANRVKLPGGRSLFAACDGGVSAEKILHDGGLRIDSKRTIDPEAGVTLSVFRRP